MEEKEINEIIKKMKKRRFELGLSYQDLADKTGISKSTLQRYETGFIKKLPIDKLQILSTALQITPGYLIGWEENEFPETHLENSTKEINDPKEAIKFILKQPSLMAYGGYDIKEMTEDELVDFTNELLREIRLISYKYKK